MAFYDKSNCCGAPLSTSTDDEGTSCWICSECGNACDPATENRFDAEVPDDQLINAVITSSMNSPKTKKEKLANAYWYLFAAVLLFDLLMWGKNLVFHTRPVIKVHFICPSAEATFFTRHDITFDCK